MLRKSLIILLILLTGLTMTVFAGGQDEAETAEEEVYVIKMLHKYYQGMGSDTPIGKIITEKFNIDFEFEKFTGDAIIEFLGALIIIINKSVRICIA